ncbi:hypothetical protein ACTFIV_007800 [Dictyostelium citrinum]
MKKTNNNIQLTKYIPSKIQFIYNTLLELKNNNINIKDYNISNDQLKKKYTEEEIDIINDLKKMNFQIVDVEVGDLKIQTIHGNFGTFINKNIVNHLVRDIDVLYVYNILHLKYHNDSNEIQNKIEHDFRNVYNFYFENYNITFQKQFLQCKYCKEKSSTSNELQELGNIKTIFNQMKLTIQSQNETIKSLNNQLIIKDNILKKFYNSVEEQIYKK